VATYYPSGNFQVVNEEGRQEPWLMPIILAAQEAEIRKIMVQSQPGANSS
jgi:hypothetical protein